MRVRTQFEGMTDSELIEAYCYLRREIAITSSMESYRRNARRHLTRKQIRTMDELKALEAVAQDRGVELVRGRRV